MKKALLWIFFISIFYSVFLFLTNQNKSHLIPQVLLISVQHIPWPYLSFHQVPASKATGQQCACAPGAPCACGCESSAAR